jgi:hypothetical protein
VSLLGAPGPAFFRHAESKAPMCFCPENLVRIYRIPVGSGPDPEARRKETRLPIVAMSSGRLFLDRVGRHQSPSPLHRQTQTNTQFPTPEDKHDISTLPGGRHFYFALTVKKAYLTASLPDDYDSTQYLHNGPAQLPSVLPRAPGQKPDFSALPVYRRFPSKNNCHEPECQALQEIQRMSLSRKTEESLLERGYSRRQVSRIALGAFASIPFFSEFAQAQQA